MISGVINTVENKYSPITTYANTKVIDHDEDTGITEFINVTISFSYPITSNCVFVVTNDEIPADQLSCSYINLHNREYSMVCVNVISDKDSHKSYYTFETGSGVGYGMRQINVYIDSELIPVPNPYVLYEVDVAPYNKNEISLSLQNTSMNVYKGMYSENVLTITANTYVHGLRVYYVNNGNFDGKIQFSFDREEWSTNYIDIDELQNGESKDIYVKITPPLDLEESSTEDITFRVAYRYTSS